MSFDAGAIRSHLELDRSPFRQGLREARREGKRFARSRWVATVDVDISRARANVRVLRGDLRNLGALTRHIQINANTSGASAQLRQLQAQAAAFGRTSANAGVDVNAGRSRAEIAALQAQVATLQTQLAQLSRTKASPSVQPRGFVAALGQVRLLQLALIGLGPAAVPVLAALAGQAVALAGALGAAAAGAAVFGVAAVGVVKPLVEYRQQLEQLNAAIEAAEPGSAEYNELLAERAELMSSLTGPQKAVLDSWDALTESFLAFGAPAQTAILGTLTNLLVGARLALEALQPAVGPVSEAVLGLSERFRAAMAGPGMGRFATWVATTGPAAIIWLAQTLVNLGATVGHLVIAFSPLTGQLVTAEGSFARLREWAAGLAVNPQFREFLAYVQVNGPLVWATLGNLANALIQIGWALAPLAPPILSLVNAVASFAAQTAAAHPWVVQLAWGALLLSRVWGPLAAGMNLVKLALQSQAAAWLLAKSRMLAYNVAMKAVRAATLLWTAAQWLLNVALSANPIGLIVIAIVAAVALIVGAVMYAWNNFDWFRNGVMAVWTAIQAGAMWLWTNGIQPVVNWIVQAWQNYLLPAIQFVAGLWLTYISTMWKIVQTLWSFIWPIIQFIALTAFALVVTALGLLWSYWKFVFNAIAAIVMWLWTNAVKPVIDWIVAGWQTYLVPALVWVQAQWSRLMDLLGAAARWLWTNVVSPVLTWIVDKFMWLYARYNYYKALLAAVFTAIGVGIGIMRDRFREAIDRVIEFGQNLLRSFRGVRDSVKEIFRTMANHARRPINWVIQTVYNDGIRKVARSTLNAVGMSELAEKIPKADTIPAFAGGGPVDPNGFVRGRGSGTSDSIFARIANREYVVNARSTARFRPLLDWINNQGRRWTGRTSNPGELPAFAEGGFVNPLELAADAVLGASKQAFQSALDALGWSGWISQLKGGAPVWEGVAGGALDFVADNLLSFLGRKDSEGGGPMAVVQAARKAKMNGSDADNDFTRAFSMVGAPWCAMFISEMIKRARAEKWYANTRSAAVASFANSGLKSVSASAAKHGDLALYRGQGPGGWGHINVVSDPRKGESIGGNEGNRIRKQYGYYASASRIIRPALAQGGVPEEALRNILGQDYAVNTRATTPLDTQFYRVLAGLPAYASGGLASEGPALIGEQGPELIDVGARARVRSAPETAQVLAEAIVRALQQLGELGGGEASQRRIGGITINGLVTLEVLRRLMHELAVEEARGRGSTGRPGAPGRRDREFEGV